VRMRVARAHHLAAILKYLYITDKVLSPEIEILIHPLVDNDPDLVGFHPGESQAVVRRKAQYAAYASFAASDEQLAIVDLTLWNLRLQRGKIVIKNEGSFVIGIFVSARALVRRAEITFWVLLWWKLRVRRVFVSLPRALCPMRRDDQPLARKWIETSM